MNDAKLRVCRRTFFCSRTTTISYEWVLDQRWKTRITDTPYFYAIDFFMLLELNIHLSLRHSNQKRPFYLCVCDSVNSVWKKAISLCISHFIFIFPHCLCGSDRIWLCPNSSVLEQENQQQNLNTLTHTFIYIEIHTTDTTSTSRSTLISSAHAHQADEKKEILINCLKQTQLPQFESFSVQFFTLNNMQLTGIYT